jgi:hypothetical protein
VDEQAYMFLWGFGGSWAIEFFTIYEILNSEDKLPRRYYSFIFWIIRLILAVVAGGIVIAYEIKQKPLLALNIGISAPLILKQLARTVPNIAPPTIPSPDKEETK